MELCLLGVGTFIRGCQWLVYKPVTFPDSGGYVRFAESLLGFDLSSLDGRRTPGYPFLLAACGLNLHVVWALQSILGILVTIILFRLLLKSTNVPAIAFIGALIQTMSLNQLFFEASITTEGLATFLLLLSVSLLSRLLRKRPQLRRRYVVLGFVIALAALTRPLLLYLGPLYVAVLATWWTKDTWRSGLWRCALCLGPVMSCVGIWSSVNYATTGHFGITTLTGFNLSQHSGAFIERAPDRYATLRDIYLKYRRIRVERTGSHSMTIWDAFPEMQEATHLSLAQLSDELSSLSLTLFVQHPELYLRGVARSAAAFWAVGQYWQLEAIKIPAVRDMLRAAWTLERLALLVVNAIFILASSSLGFGWARRVRDLRCTDTDTAVGGVVIVGCMVQAMTEYGENARYAVPFQPLILYCVATWSYQAVKVMHRKIAQSRGTVVQIDR